MMPSPHLKTLPRLLALGLRTTIITGVALFLLGPLVLMIVVALTEPSEVFGQSGQIIGTLRRISFANLEKALERVDGFQGLLFSALIGVCVAVIVAVLGLTIATEICLRKEPSRTLNATALIATKTVPAVALSTPLLVITSVLGRGGTLSFLVIMTLLLLPLFVWLVFPAIRSFMDEWYDLLAVFGLPPVPAIWLVFLPAVPWVVAVAILAMAVLAWNEGFFASALGINTVVTAIPSLLSHRGADWGSVMALGLISAIPALLLVGLGIRFGWLGRPDA